MPQAITDTTLLVRLPGLQNPAIVSLTLATLVAALPHFLRVPIWVAVMLMALLVWRLSLPPPGRAGQRPPNGLLRLGLGIAIVSGVFTSYGTLTGRDAGVALLMLLAGMKLVEMRHRRDQFVAGFIGLFLLLTDFFYIQSLLSAFYLAASVILFLNAFISFNDARQNPFSAVRLRLACAMLLQAIPLMLVLFVLFPRVNGPLWGLPRDVRAGSSGLDDQMAPGSISHLTLSDEVSFRVEFDGPLPPRADLYWRGPVLWFTDGFRWVPDRVRQSSTRIGTRGQPVRWLAR